MKHPSWPIGRIIVIVGIASLSCAAILFLRNQILGEPGGVVIDEVVMAHGVTDAGIPIRSTKSFERSDERIYCIVRLKGSASATMVARWYYEGEQIAGHYFYATPGRPGIIWLGPANGELFREGGYTIEIFVGRTLIETVRFQVGG